MHIPDIIREIDAYILSLRAARDLLSAPVPEPRPARARRSNSKARKSASVQASKTRIQKSKSTPNRVALKRALVKPPVESLLPFGGSVTRRAPSPAQPPTPATEPSRQRAVEIKILPPRSPRGSNKSVRRTTAKPATRTKQEDVKPAVALAGSVNSRIVVVSAEQARQEREKTRAAQSEVRRPRVRVSGLTGRMAFEALFKDVPDPSKSSN